MNQELVCATTTIGTSSGQLLAPTQALLRGFEFSTPDASPSQNMQAGLQQIAADAPASGVQTRQGFRVGSLNLMIRYEDGSELADMPNIYRIPNAPTWFCGMANLHGVMTPVFDLSTYLEVERNPAARQMLLVLSHGADAAGVIIDAIPERLRWSAADQVDVATAPARLVPHLRAACVIGERLYFDLECSALLDALEYSLEKSH